MGPDVWDGVSASAVQPIPLTVLEARPELVATLSAERRVIFLRVTRELLTELGDWNTLEALGDRTVARLRVLEAHLVRFTTPGGSAGIPRRRGPARTPRLPLPPDDELVRLFHEPARVTDMADEHLLPVLDGAMVLVKALMARWTDGSGATGASRHPQKAARPASDLSGDAYVGLRDLVRYSGHSERWLRDRLRDLDHPLPHHRVRRKIVVRRSDFDGWIARYRQTGDRNVKRVVSDVMARLRRVK